MSNEDEQTNRTIRTRRWDAAIVFFPVNTMFWLAVLATMLDMTPNEMLFWGAPHLLVTAIGWTVGTIAILRYHGVPLRYES